MLKIIIFVLTIMLLMSLYMLFVSRRNLERKQIKQRMATLSNVDLSLQNMRMQEGKQERKFDFVESLRKFIKDLAMRLDKVKKNNSMDFRMQQAAWPLLGTEFELISLGIGAVVAVVVGILTLNLAFAAGGFMAGILFCMLALSLRIKRRQAAFANQLGDMLTMIANALRAGFSFMQALEHIAEEMEDPVRFEVSRVVREASLGVSLDESLNNMVRRVNSPDFNLVVAAVLIQRQVGGSLAQILDTISDTINERIRMRREVSALTAQGRLSGMVLAALPFGLAAVMTFINPDYMNPLYTEPMGQIAIVGAIISIIIGGLIIRSIVNIET